MLNLKILVGSSRDGRAADTVLPWLTRRIECHGGFDVEVLDPRDWNLPMFAESFATVGNPQDPTYSHPLVHTWNNTLRSADAVVIVTPEYNHSIPAVLKNALDTLFFSFALRHKPAAVVGYSGGPVGGARAIEHLVQILIEAEAVPLRNTVLIPTVHAAFTESGDPIDAGTDAALAILLDDLSWWGRVLRDARPSSLAPALLRSQASEERHAAM
jgi:NAD(P)H-dependent FMN reductase